MILSRSKPAQPAGSAGAGAKEKKKKRLPKLEDFVQARDYVGAITLLEFLRSTERGSGGDTALWLAYCWFHNGDYARARKEYESLSEGESCHPDVWSNLACCYFMLGMYPEAETVIQKAPKSLLQNRLQFHLSHKVSSLSSLYSLSFLLASLQFGDEKKLMVHHQALQNTIEDQVCQPLSALFLSSLSSLPHTAESSCHPLPQNALPRGH
jgi:intraflagellar transport protein 56